MWLKEMESGKYFNETYIAHTVLNNDISIAILTYTRILVIRSDSLKLDLSVLWDDIQSIEVTAEGLRVQLKKDSIQIIPIEERTSREWFANIIQRTIAERKEELERQ
jgi:vacuolar protein sorting-associated protein 13A/C